MKMIPVTENDVTYEIVAMDESAVSITVVFRHKDYDYKFPVHIDLEIKDDYTVASGDELHKFIMVYAPLGQISWFISRWHAAGLTNMDHIAEMVAETKRRNPEMFQQTCKETSRESRGPSPVSSVMS